MLQRLAGVFSMLHGLRKKDAVEETEQPNDMPKPSKEEILNLVQKFKMSASDWIDVSSSNEKTIEYLKSLGLVTVVEEHFLNASTGTIECRKTAKWNSWRCEDCAHFFVGDMKTKPSLVADEVTLKNVAQCSRGFSMEFRDGRKGKRCPYFEDKRLLEVLNDGVE